MKKNSSIITHHNDINDKESSSKNSLTIDEENYLISLNEKEKKAYEIARSHLGTTFHLMKSNGFIEWKKTTL